MDDDVDQLELMNYTNSLRSSARKLIQKQLAQDSGSRSLKLKTTSSITRPHVEEVFRWNSNSTNSSDKILDRGGPTFSYLNNYQPLQVTLKSTSSNDLSKTNSQSVVFREGPDGKIHPSPAQSAIHKSQNELNQLAIPTVHKFQDQLNRPSSPTVHKLQDQLNQPTSPAVLNYQDQLNRPASPAVQKSQGQLNRPVSPAVHKSQGQLNRSLSPAVQKFLDHLSRPTSPAVHKSQGQLNHISSPLTYKSQNQLNHTPNLAIHKSQGQLNQTRNPLEYNFLPLSSSELVKQQIAVADRVLKTTKPTDEVDKVTSLRSRSKDEAVGISSGSSSQDNDSGRGSYPFLADSPTRPPRRAESPTRPLRRAETPTSATRNGRVTFEDESSTPSRSPMSSDSTGNGNAVEENQSSLNRRYVKNRSPTRHYLQKQKQLSTNEEPLAAEEQHIPHPFNPGNLSPVAGYGRGIQGSINSSFAEATLFSLFACTNIFDVDLLYSKPGQAERGLKKEIREILRQKIVIPLRTKAYCKSENVTHLREAMLPLSSKMHSSLMEADEFLYLLFDSALNSESFIQFSNGTKDFMHQILARPKDRSKSQTVQFMLETSLGTSELKFKGVPKPALMLCMPRCKGRLVYYEAIIPTLQLNITRLLHKGPKQCVCEMAATLECVVCHQQNGDIALDFCGVCKGISDQIHFRLDHAPVLVSKSQKDEILNLNSIICTRGNRYVAFVKATPHRLSPWLFFDPLAGEFPEVTVLEDFGRWLDSLEKQPGHYREFSKLHPLLKRIMTDSHIYIYSKAHIVETPNYTESLVI